MSDDELRLCWVPHDVRQGKLTLDLHEPHGWLYGPERRDTNTDAVDSESLIRQLLRPWRCVRFLLHVAFVGAILHIFAKIRGPLSAGLLVRQCTYKLQDTHAHTVLCAHNTIPLRTYISVAGRLLAVCLHFAVLTSTRICCVTVYKVLAHGH
jgi:hypothetical protein